MSASKDRLDAYQRKVADQAKARREAADRARRGRR